MTTESNYVKIVSAMSKLARAISSMNLLVDIMGKSIIIMSKSDFSECYWCMKARAVIVVDEPTYDIFPPKKTLMCENCFRNIRKPQFPFEPVRYKVIKYGDL